MKTLKLFILTFFIAFLLSSCASSKKYQTALADQKSLQQKYDQIQKDNSQLKAEIDQLKSSASNEQQSITNKEAAISKEEASLKDLKSLIDEQRDAINNLRQEVCNAVRCFTPDQLTVEVRDGKLYVHMSDKLLFPTGSDIVNPEGKKAIAAIAEVLAKSNLEIMVEGHTDNVPIHNQLNKDNWDLSCRRATSVSRIFIKDGVNPTRVIASGRSHFFPVASNETAQGRQDNRRTEIVLAPKLDKLWKLAEQDNNVSGINTNNISQ